MAQFPIPGDRPYSAKLKHYIDTANQTTLATAGALAQQVAEDYLSDAVPEIIGVTDAQAAALANSPASLFYAALDTLLNERFDEFDAPTSGPWINVTAAPYNADRTGATDARAAIQSAIDAVAAAGGGTVFLPAGVYQIAYAGNAGGTGCAGGLQLRDSVTLRGEGVATRLFGSGVWFSQAGIVAVGDAATTRAVRDASVRELWIKTSAGTGHTTSIPNCNGILLNSNGIVTEPDAAHRLLDLTIWDCDRGISVYGVADRAATGQRIRLRHFLRQAVLIGKENNSGGGADGYWSDIDASSANRVANGGYATFEIRSSNCHLVNCKAWYSKRETAFVESGDYIAGAGFALMAPRTTLVACEAQDNGGHGIVVRVGQQTLTSCVADSNNRSDCISGSALPYECSGFYIGGSATNVTILAANSFDKRSDLAERFQKHGYAVHASSRNIEIRGLAKDNRASSSSATPEDGVAFVSGGAHETHSIYVQSTYESQRTIIDTSDGNAGVAYVPVIDTRTATQPARRIELDFPLDTANPNLVEIRDERDEIVSWDNEAGQYRFRNPYSTWADSGVRGIVEAGDYTGTALGGGNFMELVNRTLVDSNARKVWGVRWGTGRTVRYGKEVPDLLVRSAASDPITHPDPAVIVTLDGEVNSSGSEVHSWDGGALPTVSGGVSLSAGAGIVNADMLLVANDATAAHARFEVTSVSTLAFRTYIKTPAAWPSSAATIIAFRPSTSTIAAGVSMTATGSPGRLRLLASGGAVVAETPANTLAVNTNYRVELRYNAALKTATLAVYAMGEDVALWSSGARTHADFDSTITRVDVGRITTTPSVPNFYLDGIKVVMNAAIPLGRHAGDVLSPTAAPKPPYEGPLSYWDGTTLHPMMNHG